MTSLSTGLGRSNGWVAVHQYVGAPYESYFQQVADIMDSRWATALGKDASMPQLCERYPRWGEFQNSSALDPDGTFRNEYVDRALRRAQRSDRCARGRRVCGTPTNLNSISVLAAENLMMSGLRSV